MKAALILILATGAITPALLAADDPKVGYSTSEAGTWSASARGTPTEPAVAPGPAEFTVRVFEGDGRIGPVYGRNGEVMALDVTTEIETCADGNTRVNALRIGSWRYQLEGDCTDFHRASKITVSQGPGGTIIEQQQDGDPAPGGSRVIHCDPATWSCRTETD